MKTEIYTTRPVARFVETWDGPHAGWYVVEVLEHFERDVDSRGRTRRARARIEFKKGTRNYLRDADCKRDPTLTQCDAIAMAHVTLAAATKVLILAATEKPRWKWKADK